MIYMNRRLSESPSIAISTHYDLIVDFCHVTTCRLEDTTQFIMACYNPCNVRQTPVVIVNNPAQAGLHAGLHNNCEQYRYQCGQYDHHMAGPINL
ncbi:hypothetical protein VDGE_30685 [Verticillium dahliae]|uniref:Uncharacterized protein n=1 Tax=Verticillium dahliae TaxID=27337 RepID=A0A444RJG7_VERDA|nr:hypothetical protein VDGE_30685 [Verticillium dahliae]